MNVGISAERYVQRLASAGKAIDEAGISALAVGVGPDLEWLVGYAAHGLERLNLLVILPSGAASFIGPRLELGAALASPGLGSGAVEMITWTEGQDPLPLVAQCIPASTADGTRIAVSDGLRAAFLLGLQAVLGQADFEVASSTLGPLRQVKDVEEVALLREAAHAADRVIAAVVDGPLVGRAEADIAREVRERLVIEGHDTAEFSIVAGGPHTASPHHEPGDRIVAAGEPLLFDIGGRRAGYFSDITRTVWVAGADGLAPDADFVRIHDVVRAAQAAARAAVRPGLSFEDLDLVARDVITDAGHGEDFFHRLGHGIGLEVHEDPYCVSGNRQLLAAGNTFSIEPGIYLEGRYGVRIEDAVLCTETGVDTLNEAPRELLVVPGA